MADLASETACPDFKVFSRKMMFQTSNSQDQGIGGGKISPSPRFGNRSIHAHIFFGVSGVKNWLSDSDGGRVESWVGCHRETAMTRRIFFGSILGGGYSGPVSGRRSVPVSPPALSASVRSF